MPSLKRWSMIFSDEEAAPQGSADDLDLAKEELEPFEAKHSAIAPCYCEKCAEEQLRSLAMSFNRYRLATEGAPRHKNVLDRLPVIYPRRDLDAASQTSCKPICAAENVLVRRTGLAFVRGRICPTNLFN
jgi:hypothetical protein